MTDGIFYYQTKSPDLALKSSLRTSLFQNYFYMTIFLLRQIVLIFQRVPFDLHEESPLRTFYQLVAHWGDRRSNWRRTCQDLGSSTSNWCASCFFLITKVPQRHHLDGVAHRVSVPWTSSLCSQDKRDDCITC